MNETLEISVKPCYKSAKPWIPGMLKRGGKHVMKTKKCVRSNDKVRFRNEN